MSQSNLHRDLCDAVVTLLNWHPFQLPFPNEVARRYPAAIANWTPEQLSELIISVVADSTNRKMATRRQQSRMYAVSIVIQTRFEIPESGDDTEVIDPLCDLAEEIADFMIPQIIELDTEERCVWVSMDMDPLYDIDKMV